MLFRNNKNSQIKKALLDNVANKTSVFLLKILVNQRYSKSDQLMMQQKTLRYDFVTFLNKKPIFFGRLFEIYNLIQNRRVRFALSFMLTFFQSEIQEKSGQSVKFDVFGEPVRKLSFVDVALRLMYAKRKYSQIKLRKAQKKQKAFEKVSIYFFVHLSRIRN